MSERWAPVRPEYYVQTGGMHENPFGVPRDEIVRMILENPAEVVAQVVFGKYVESSGLVFISDIVQRLFDRKQGRVAGSSFTDQTALKYASQITPHRSFLESDCPFHTGVDLARQTDYTVITTLDTTVMPARVVYYRRLNRVPWETIYREIGMARLLWGPNILCDSTGMGGDVVMDALDSRFICSKHKRTGMIGSRCIDPRTRQPLDCKPEDYLPLSVAEGYDFSGSTKKELVEHLRNVLSVGYDEDHPDAEFGWLRCPPIVQLEEELSFYSWDDKRLVTDCLFSLALAAWSGLEDPVDQPEAGSPAGL